MKRIKTTQNFKIGLFFIDDNGTRVFNATFKTVAAAEKDAKEILLANDLVGREYLIAFVDNDNEITNVLYYVRLVLNDVHVPEFRLTAFSY